MKISFIATVYNEEKTIKDLLDSLFKQTKMPDEIVIVDGGSSDLTVAKIQSYNSKLKILIRPGTTIAQARNIGVRNALGDVIAMSDAGCVLHKDWLEKITIPFIKEEVDVVAGFYQMTGVTPLQQALAVYLGIPPKMYNPNKFLPSARSMAFKKSLWKKIGGFNEKLKRAGEDTLFNYEAIKYGAKFVRVKDALVDWEIPNNIWTGMKKFYIYAKGDLQTGIWWHPLKQVSTHNLKIASVFVRYGIGLVMLFLAFRSSWFLAFIVAAFLLYLLYPVWKMRDVVTDFRARLWLPVVQLISDIAILLAMI